MLAGFERLTFELVNSDFNRPIWRQFSDNSKSCLVCHVVRRRWRHRGTGDVDPAPEQFGPKYPEQSNSDTPGVTSMGLSRATLPVKLKFRLPAPATRVSRFQKYRPSKSTPLVP